MKAALFFGSFNPVHNGHLALAQSIIEQKTAEEVWFVLSPQNPFKNNAELWSEEIRAKRLKEALKGRKNFVFCDVELQLPKPSYTVQTLQYLWKEYPGHEFCILMGEDNIERMHQWKEYKKILERCHVYYYPREGSAPAGSDTEYPVQKEFPGKIHKIKYPPLNISSTQIRAMIAEGKDISQWVP